MSEYVRTTRECSVRQLHPELLQAIQNYFQEHKLGNVQSEELACCETVSRKKSVGKIVSWLHGSPDTTIYTGILLTSQWLIWVHHGDQSGTRINGARLNEIRAVFHTSRFPKDAGLKMVGFIADANAHVNGFIGMGTDLAARKFCEEVTQTAIKANPPAKKGIFRWLGG